MAQTLYARSDVINFPNPTCPTGGHFRKIENLREFAKDPEHVLPVYGDERLTVNCDTCEPILRSFVHNLEDRRTGETKVLGTWSDDAELIPLTKGEENAAKKASDQMAKSLGTAQAEMFKQFQQWVAAGMISPES